MFQAGSGNGKFYGLLWGALLCHTMYERTSERIPSTHTVHDMDFMLFRKIGMAVSIKHT